MSRYASGWKISKELVCNVKEVENIAYCAYCSTIIGDIVDDSIILVRLPVLTYYHDTILRSCGLHRPNVTEHAHFYELTVRPVSGLARPEKLVVRVHDSFKHGIGNICSSFDKRRYADQSTIFKSFDGCEPDSITRGLTLAPSITSDLVILILFMS